MLGGFEELQPSVCSTIYQVNLHPSVGGEEREWVTQGRALSEGKPHGALVA